MAAFATYFADGLHTCLWKLDRARQRLERLRELDSQDESYVDIASSLDVDGDAIVWYDDRHGRAQQDVFAFDLSGRTETQLTNYGCCAGETRLWGNRVAFQGWAEGPRGIYTRTCTSSASRRSGRTA